MTAAGGAVLGGVSGGVLMLAGAAVLGVWALRHRGRIRGAAGSTAPPVRDRRD